MRIFYSCVRRTMKFGSLRLRPLRISDGPMIKERLGAMKILRPDAMDRLFSMSSLSLCWWLKKTCPILYCIDVGSECIGLTGLYDLRTDGSCELAMVIFEERNRRRGFGTTVFSLLADNLSCHSARIRVRILKDNSASLSFWKRLGFEEIRDTGGEKVMCFDLKTGGRQRLHSVLRR